ncbi:hypothetical protein Taro_030781 [Colocasia esculenta]|uniref:Uncharacterized protein n=1 Tax=Colocasia esculenta TaxID=4460 RepID=A0A843W4D0_COLES|nr:hypothetical protein [Colocasia esculenta]
MHLNPEGNTSATRNEHNIVLGKPHFRQNQQRKTLGAPHQSSQLSSTRPTTSTDKCRNAQPAMQHGTQNICLAQAITPTKQSTGHNSAQIEDHTQDQHSTQPNNRGTTNKARTLQPVPQTTTLHQ